MKRARQLNFSAFSKKFKYVSSTAFGGERFARYNPSSSRPLAAHVPVHVVLRSDVAKGGRSLLRFDKDVRSIVFLRAKALGIKIKEFANVGNHIHLVVMLPSVRVWGDFIRSITGLIARLVMGAERGSAVGERFWVGRPWSRIVAWGRDLAGVVKYLGLNHIEALGFSRKTALVLKSMKLEGVLLQC